MEAELSKASGLEDDRLTTWGLVVEGVSRVGHRLEHDVQEIDDLPITWFEVLLRLGRTPGTRLRVTELSDQVSFSQSGLSRLADRMEDAGLIERVLCRTDRRGTELALTDLGRKRIEAATQTHVRGIQAYLLDHLTATDRTHLERIMRKLRAANPGDGFPTDPPSR